jgi:hypothetical protein
MNRIDDRTVELTDDREERATNKFNELLDRGVGIPKAAKLALNRNDTMLPPSFGDAAFVAWLSDDTVERWGSRYRIKPSAR